MDKENERNHTNDLLNQGTFEYSLKITCHDRM